MEKYSSYLADYIRPAIDKKYRTRSDAADDLGIDQAVLSRICSGKRFGISEHLIENICMRLELDVAEGLLRLFLSKNTKIKQHFLELIKETSIEIVHPSKYKPSDHHGKSLSDSYVPVPFISGNTIDSLKNIGKREKPNFTLVPKNFLPHNGNFIAYKIKGDSMEPTLPAGSIIVANLNDTKGVNNCMYLFKQKNEIKVGRAFIQENFLQVCHDNQNKNKFSGSIYDMEKIKQKNDTPIIGKIVWILKKF